MEGDEIPWLSIYYSPC